MDKSDNNFGKKRHLENKNREFDEEADFEDLNESPSFKKNPSTSNMSLRHAKKLWFSPRKSGRPSKDISDKLEEAKKVLETAGAPLKRVLVRKSRDDHPKRPRGRPKKAAATVKEKKPRGRPRKNPISIDRPKRPRGRPRKHILNTDTNKPQRSRGRPRKNLENPLEEKNT